MMDSRSHRGSEAIASLSSTMTSIDSQGRVIGTWADVLNRANLGMEVMHERNAHNFPLDLAAGEAAPVALTAPVING
jgi:photosystem II P680 reaction center D1 protein